jgi:hypothetical protein
MLMTTSTYLWVCVQVPPLMPLGLKRLKLLAAWCMEPKTYIKGKVLMEASDAPTRVIWLKTGQCALLPDPRSYDEEAIASARERQERQVIRYAATVRRSGSPSSWLSGVETASKPKELPKRCGVHAK